MFHFNLFFAAQFRKIIKIVVFSSVLVSYGGTCYAASYNVNLNVLMANTTFSSREFISAIDGRHYRTDIWQANPSGLSSSNALTLRQGDVVNLAMNLDRVFTFPAASSSSQYLHIMIAGAAVIDFDISATIQTFNEGLANATFNFRSSGNAFGPVVNFSMFAGSMPVSFDRVVSSFYVNSISQLNVLSSSSAYWGVTTPIPEPGTFLLMVGGVAAFWASTRNRPERVIRLD